MNEREYMITKTNTNVESRTQ